MDFTNLAMDESIGCEWGQKGGKSVKRGWPRPRQDKIAVRQMLDRDYSIRQDGDRINIYGLLVNVPKATRSIASRMRPGTPIIR